MIANFITSKKTIAIAKLKAEAQVNNKEIVNLTIADEAKANVIA
jgi:hypothetical protein